MVHESMSEKHFRKTINVNTPFYFIYYIKCKKMKKTWRVET